MKLKIIRVIFDLKDMWKLTAASSKSKHLSGAQLLYLRIIYTLNQSSQGDLWFERYSNTSGWLHYLLPPTTQHGTTPTFIKELLPYPNYWQLHSATCAVPWHPPFPMRTGSIWPGCTVHSPTYQQQNTISTSWGSYRKTCLGSGLPQELGAVQSSSNEQHLYKFSVKLSTDR